MKPSFCLILFLALFVLVYSKPESEMHIFPSNSQMRQTYVIRGEGGSFASSAKQPQTLPTESETIGATPSRGECVQLNGWCNLTSAMNPMGKGQCCKGLHCQPTIIHTGWPTFVCTKNSFRSGDNLG